MNVKGYLIAAAMGFALLPGVTCAEVYVVNVEDNFYSPNDVTIGVGDTVRWVNAAGGNPHNVTADDGSFASETASSFMYERTFNSLGEVLYYCTIHSAPGLDRDTNMNGRIVVQEEEEEFPINAGLNDSWFNPATPGQGFFITVFPDIQMMFLAWFTYDTERPAPEVMANLGEPGHRWLTAFGPYAGDTAMLEVELTEGGVFDSSEPEVVESVDGTIEVQFSDCNAGMVTYDITSAAVSGQIPIERIALDNVPVCEALAAP